MSRIFLIACFILLAMLIVQGCGDSDNHVTTPAGGEGGGGGVTSLGLDKYRDDVVQGLPMDPSHAKDMDPMTVEIYMLKILQHVHESGNLVREATRLDLLIDDLNSLVSSDHEVIEEWYDGEGEGEGDGEELKDGDLPVVVIPNPDGTLTLPFFDTTVQIDYLVRLHENGTDATYAGYRLSDDEQIVVLFTSMGGSWGDRSLFYGRKAGDVVEIWNAGLGFDGNDDWYKASAFKLRLMISTGQFAVTADGTGYLDSGQIFGIASSGAGYPNSYFLYRVREDSNALGNLDCANFYDYTGGDYDLVDSILLGGVGDPRLGGALSVDDWTRPETISVADWEDMIAATSIIGDPDDHASIVPMTASEFCIDFIKSKFD